MCGPRFETLNPFQRIFLPQKRADFTVFLKFLQLAPISMGFSASKMTNFGVDSDTGCEVPPNCKFGKTDDVGSDAGCEVPPWCKFGNSDDVGSDTGCDVPPCCMSGNSDDIGSENGCEVPPCC